MADDKKPDKKPKSKATKATKATKPTKPPTREQMSRTRLADMGGSEWILAEIEAGRTEIDLADDLGIDRTLYYKLRKELKISPDVLKASRREHAKALMDESARILDRIADNPKVTSRQVGIARARSENCLKRAERWNREDFGRQQVTQVDVNLTLSGVFIQALSDMSGQELASVAAGEVSAGEVGTTEILGEIDSGEPKQLEAGG